jgi:hypothetical protein
LTYHTELTVSGGKLIIDRPGMGWFIEGIGEEAVFIAGVN